jgi:hypothetical protein
MWFGAALLRKQSWHNAQGCFPQPSPSQALPTGLQWTARRRGWKLDSLSFKRWHKHKRNGIQVSIAEWLWAEGSETQGRPSSPRDAMKWSALNYSLFSAKWDSNWSDTLWGYLEHYTRGLTPAGLQPYPCKPTTWWHWVLTHLGSVRIIFGLVILPLDSCHKHIIILRKNNLYACVYSS